MSFLPEANPVPPVRGGLPGRPTGELGGAAGGDAVPACGAGEVRVLVAEDNPFVRAGIVGLLEQRAGLVCCAQVGSLAAAAQAVAQHRPELVLMDLQLEEGESLEFIQSLRLRFPSLPVLVLSNHDENVYAGKALQAGARGYLMKEAAAEHLLTAIGVLLEGRTYLSPAMTTLLACSRESEVPPWLPTLS